MGFAGRLKCDMFAVLAASVTLLGVPSNSLLNHAMREWKATPRMGMEDAYKWLFHATLGGEHAVTDDEGPRRWLDREWDGLGKPKPGEREVVPLTPDGRLARINLRVYKARGGDKEMLLAVFVASAQRFHADRAEFVREWRSLGSRLRTRPWGGLKFSDWSRVDRTMGKAGYPAIEHSEGYERAYRPAYRVVLRELWTP